MYTLRSIKYIILHKGGQTVTIITHTPFGGNRLITVLLKNLDCKQTRTQSKYHIPLKVKGHIMYYTLDMKGDFKHPQLFDNTCGLARAFK